MRNRIVKIALCAIVALALSVGLEYVQISSQPPIVLYDYEMSSDAIEIFPAEDIIYSNSELRDGYLVEIGPDPQMIINTQDEGAITSLLITLAQETDQMMRYQVFFAPVGMGFSEDNSVSSYLMPGRKEFAVDLPQNVYSQIRFDFDKPVSIAAIECSAFECTKTPMEEEAARPHLKRLAIVAASLFAVILFSVRIHLGAKVADRISQIKKIRFTKENFIDLAIGLGTAVVSGFALYVFLQRLDFVPGWQLKMFCAASSLACGALVCFRKAIARKPEGMLALLILLAGSMYVLMLPTNLMISWDDEYHYKNMVNVSYVDEVRFTGADTMLYERRVKNFFTNEQNTNLSANLDSLYEDGVVSVEANLIDQTMVWAIPGAAMMFIGRALGLSYTAINILARLGNLLAYALISYFAVKRLKSGKMLLSVLLLGSTNIFLAGCFSYDPFVTACAALGMSYYFAEWQEPGKKLEWKNALIMVLSLAIGALPKAIYFFMLLVFLWMPKEKFVDKKHRNLYWALVIGAAAAVFVSFALPFVMDMGSKTDLRGGSDVSASEQIKFILTQPLEYLKILVKFLLTYLSPSQSFGYFTNLAYLGYAGFLEVYLITLGITMFTDKNEYDRNLTGKWGMRGWAHLILFGTVVLVATSLYVGFTPVRLATINGCQPRYLLPILFPSIYLLGSGKIQNNMDRSWYNILVFAGAGVAAFGTVLTKVIAMYI